MQQGFRADIQALRGVAVSLVLLYHADFGFFKAGFLGVDIFFVISGYLITTLIKTEIEKGTFKFSEFYFRRAKRLLPAAYTTFVVTAVAAPFVLNAQELQDFFKQMLGAVTFTANLALLLQTGYFAGAADLKPLLHVWSLSIEEQYYLLLPAFLVFLPRRFWRGGVLVVFLASIGLCFAGLKYKPEWTFYLLPTRGWELALGSLAAIYNWRGKWLQLILKGLFWPSVVVLLLIPVWPTGLPHPGVDAVLVCMATLVVILRRHAVIDRLLPVRALALVGDVSYSLYLAHWPPFAFLKNAAVGPVTWQLSLLTLLLGIGLGVLLYRFVELPTRRLQLHPSRKFILGGLAASMAVMTLPVVVAKTPDTGLDFAHIRRPNDGFAAPCAYESDFVPKRECRNSDNPSLLVWGDSYAMHLVSGVLASWPHGVMQATRGSCGPFSNLAPMSDVFYLQPWAESCLKFNRDVLAYLEQSKSIRLVVMSSPFKQYLNPIDGKHHWRGLRQIDGKFVEQEVGLDNALAAMVETIRAVRALGKDVVIISPPPAGGFNVGACTERRMQGKLVIAAPTADCTIPVDVYHSSYALTLEFLRRLNSETGVALVSFDPVLCDEKRCANKVDGSPVYVDAGHLTHEASVLLAGKLDMANILSEAGALNR